MPPAQAIALGLIMGGAAGNLIDRLLRDEGLLRGAVVDFIDLQWFPVFNVADAAINIGAVLLVLALLLEARSTDSGRET
jgi:signal peptidase II